MILRAVLLTLFGVAFLLNGRTEPKELNIGDKAPGFELENFDGKTVSLDSYDNSKGYIVIFTCNNCPYAKAYQDRIAELQNMYSSKGFPVIAINTSDPSEEIAARAKEENYPFPYLHDDTQEVTRSYGATRTPHVFVLDKDRTVAYIGAIDNNYKDASKADKHYVKDAVDALLNDQEVEVKNTKAIGCTIKWKNS
jgi:peroxiredoxin